MHVIGDKNTLIGSESLHLISDDLGMQNRGDQAPFKYFNSMNFGDPVFSDYKGVFLNQSGPPNWIPPYYSIKIPSSIDLSQNGGEHYLYLQSWTLDPSSSVDFNLENPNEWGVVFKENVVTITANVKATGLSDDQNAYLNNGQRKTLRTPDYNNLLHRVYESLGHVWYETSSDDGQTWELMNDGQPLDNGGGKKPAMDWVIFNGGGALNTIYVVIVFQQVKAGGGYTIESTVFGCRNEGNNPFLFQKYPSEAVFTSGNSYSFDSNHVVALDPADNCAGVYIAWQNSDTGLKLRIGGLVPLPNEDPLTLGSTYPVLSTNVVSKNSSIASSISTYQTYVGLAWEENNQIKYTTFNGIAFGSVVTLSAGNGYNGNANPSIVVLSDSYGRVCWKGSYCAYQEDPPEQQSAFCYSKVVFKGTNNSRFWIFGNNTGSPNMNKSDDENYYAIVWSSSDGSSTYFTNNSLGTPKEIGIPGKYIQVSNGPSKDYMYTEVFNNSSEPYYFITSDNLGTYYSLHKETDYAFSSGREGVIYSDTAQFFFTVGDVNVDGQSINFIEIPDSLDVNTKSLMNEYLKSETFQLTDNSTFLYSIEYGITDSLAALSLLGNTNKFISFKLELIDTQSSEILDSFDEVTYDQLNLPQFNNFNYQVNIEGIGNRTVYLGLKVNDNFDPNYSLGELYSIGNTLQKTTVKIRNYYGQEVVKNYNLFSNFPNPFNPSTTINYQLPESGFVSLKVYDILGKEVATLVNEQKNQGRYSVNFDASNLASGVYVYRLQVNDPSAGSGQSFVNVKKMILLK